MNPNFDCIGKSFLQHYYNLFDTIETRKDAISCYSPDALLTFEGEQCYGQEGIKQKLLEKVHFGSIKRVITKSDCHPLPDGGVLVFALGQLVELGTQDSDRPKGFTQCFILKPQGSAFHIANEIFRLTLYDYAA